MNFIVKSASSGHWIKAQIKSFDPVSNSLTWPVFQFQSLFQILLIISPAKKERKRKMRKQNTCSHNFPSSSNQSIQLRCSSSVEQIYDLRDEITITSRNTREKNPQIISFNIPFTFQLHTLGILHEYQWKELEPILRVNARQNKKAEICFLLL